MKDREALPEPSSPRMIGGHDARCARTTEENSQRFILVADEQRTLDLTTL